jgi:hypothetical protein
MANTGRHDRPNPLVATKSDQYITNTGRGNQFSHATFNGDVYFDESRRRSHRRQNKVLRRLDVAPYQPPKPHNHDVMLKTWNDFVKYPSYRF